MNDMSLQATAELARFLGVPLKEAVERVESYSVLNAAEIWAQTKHSTPDEVENFYQVNDFYLYELIPWNYSSPEFHRRIEPLIHFHNKRIVELGAGIGSLCIALAYAGNQMFYVDINLKLQQFAAQRFIDRQLAIPIYSELTHVRDIDIIVAIDFFEHVHPARLPDLLKECASVLRDGGFIYHRSNFKQQNIYPMHYDHSAYFNKMAKDAGLNLREDGSLVKSQESMGIQIGIPTPNDMPDPLFFSFLNMKKRRGWLITKMKGDNVADARNKIVAKLEKDWLFFMDSDQTFHPDTIERLLSWNVDCISGLYFKTPGIPVPHAYEFAYESQNEQSPANDYWYYPITNKVNYYLEKYKDEIYKNTEAIILPKENLIPIDGCGGGCLLVHRRVFEKLEKPYFAFPKEEVSAGEDFYFCRKVRQAGFQIYLDPGVICGHKMKGFVGAAHFLNWQHNQKDGKDVLEFPYPWELENPNANVQRMVER